MAERLDTPKPRRKLRLPRIDLESEGIGRGAEAIAKFSGTPKFLIYLTVFCLSWMAWNTWAPQHLRFDSADLGFTALTLMLSMQASYSDPLILLAQYRQDNRDRVIAEQDRQRAERTQADTEYLTREIASLRMAMQDVATRDFVRGELRDLLEDIIETRAEERAREKAEAALEAERARLAQPTGQGEPAGQAGESEAAGGAETGGAHA